MKQIIPAIIGQTYAEIERQLQILEGHTTWVHLDVTDGHFTPVASWPARRQGGNVVEEIRFLNGQAKIEVHLMVEQSETIIRDWAEVADRIIVHQEATEHLEEIIDFFTPLPIEIGVALLLPTPIEALTPYFSQVDLVQLMSIAEIGAQGYPFDDRVLEKVKHLQLLAPDGIIQIDGGVNLANAPTLIGAGVDNLVVGSAIWQTPNPLSSLLSFQSLLQATS